MREIAFRFWNKKLKKMSKPCGLGPIYEFLCIAWDVFSWDDVEIMQYTGLHDNTKWEQLTVDEQMKWLSVGKSKEEWKGREIYEGDICKNCDYILDAHISDCRIELVQYIEDEACFVGFNFNDGEGGSCEVIGNIYENPSLLEEG
jgi:uncharacterized phage protein (TIGR01671 family)